MADIHLHVHMTPRVFRWGVTTLLLCAAATELSSENVTLSTYYPAPSGVYTKMITTGTTYLARDGGRVGIGLGTVDPTQALDVNGLIKIRQGAPGVGKVLTSDADGVGTWQTPSRRLICVTVENNTQWANCPADYEITGCGTLASGDDDQIRLNPATGRDACFNDEYTVWARCCKTAS